MSSLLSTIVLTAVFLLIRVIFIREWLRWDNDILSPIIGGSDFSSSLFAVQLRYANLSEYLRSSLFTYGRRWFRRKATWGGVWWIIWRLLKNTGVMLRGRPATLHRNWEFRSQTCCFGENWSAQILVLGQFWVVPDHLYSAKGQVLSFCHEGVAACLIRQSEIDFMFLSDFWKSALLKLIREALQAI
jgi:hypothetical protein